MKELSVIQKNKLAEFGVIAVYIFGSQAQGTTNPFSDFDFAILLQQSRVVHTTTSILYEPIYDILSDVTQPETLAADVIDIVFLDSPRVPLELKSHIVRHGQLLLDLQPQQRVNFEDRIMQQTADFAPLRLQMSQALLARI